MQRKLSHARRYSFHCPLRWQQCRWPNATAWWTWYGIVSQSSDPSADSLHHRIPMAFCVSQVTGKVNPRGIPEMVFLEDLESTLASKRMTIEELLQNLQTMFKCVRRLELLFYARPRVPLFPSIPHGASASADAEFGVVSMAAACCRTCPHRAASIVLWKPAKRIRGCA